MVNLMLDNANWDSSTWSGSFYEIFFQATIGYSQYQYDYTGTVNTGDYAALNCVNEGPFDATVSFLVNGTPVDTTPTLVTPGGSADISTPSLTGGDIVSVFMSMVPYQTSYVWDMILTPGGAPPASPFWTDFLGGCREV